MIGATKAAAPLSRRDVVDGDSVWKVAASALQTALGRVPTHGEINDYKQQIIDLNGLKPPFVIHQNDSLQLPEVTQPPAKAPAPTMAPKAPAMPTAHGTQKDGFGKAPGRATTPSTGVGNADQKSADELAAFLKDKKTSALEGPRQQLGALADEFAKNPALAKDPAALKRAAAQMESQFKGLDETQARALQEDPSFAALSNVPALETYRAAQAMEKTLGDKGQYGTAQLQAFSKKLESLSPEARKAVEAECPKLAEAVLEANKGLIRKGGEAVVHGAEAVQNFVDGGVKALEHSAIGNNAVGHFIGGLVSGVAGAVTGTVKMAGGAAELGDADVRASAGKKALEVIEHPVDTAVGIGHAVKDAWSKDHAHFLGGVAAALLPAAGAIGKLGKLGKLEAAEAGAAEVEKEVVKETAKETAKEGAKETAKETAKDGAQEGAKQGADSAQKGANAAKGNQPPPQGQPPPGADNASGAQAKSGPSAATPPPQATLDSIRGALDSGDSSAIFQKGGLTEQLRSLGFSDARIDDKVMRFTNPKTGAQIRLPAGAAFRSLTPEAKQAVIEALKKNEGFDAFTFKPASARAEAPKKKDAEPSHDPSYEQSAVQNLRRQLESPLDLRTDPKQYDRFRSDLRAAGFNVRENKNGWVCSRGGKSVEIPFSGDRSEAIQRMKAFRTRAGEAPEVPEPPPAGAEPSAQPKPERRTKDAPEGQRAEAPKQAEPKPRQPPANPLEAVRDNLRDTSPMTQERVRNLVADLRASGFDVHVERDHFVAELDGRRVSIPFQGADADKVMKGLGDAMQPSAARRAETTQRAERTTQAGFTDSRRGLEHMMKEVWDAKKNGQRYDSDAVYDMYNQVTEANPLRMPKQQFLDELESIRAQRPRGARSNMQNNDPESFHRFEGPNFNQLTRRSDLNRVYINAAANTSPKLMNFIVKQLIDSGKFPGVAMAKISGPRALGARCENIVIYASQAEVKNILREVEKQQAAHPEWFMRSTPQMADRVMPGVAVAEEPAVGGGAHSFGSLRADIIADAARNARDYADFQRRVGQGMVDHQINPNKPHLNLRPGDV